MQETSEPYLLEYNAFMSQYQKGQTSGEEVGAVIAKLAQYYCQKNILMGKYELLFFKTFSNFTSQLDEGTGKQMTMAKSEILAKATPEAEAYMTEKTHLENLEQCINALKSLQRGLCNEYSHVGAV